MHPFLGAIYEILNALPLRSKGQKSSQLRKAQTIALIAMSALIVIAGIVGFTALISR